MGCRTSLHVFFKKNLFKVTAVPELETLNFW